MKDEEKLKEIAEEIYIIETECGSEGMDKIEQVIQSNSLSLEELLEIDAYIQEKYKLTN